MITWTNDAARTPSCNLVTGNPRDRLPHNNIVPENWDRIPTGYERLRQAGSAHTYGSPGKHAVSRKAVCVAAALLLVAVLLFTACGEAFSNVSQAERTPLASMLLDHHDDAPVSTPVSEWKKGAYPYLYQTDRQWKDVSYAGGTIEDSGCGPTSLSMVYVGLTGKTNHTPATLSAFSEDAGYVDSGMTSWTYMTEGAATLGLRSRELPADASIITSALHAGEPVIVSLAPGDFTDVGHFIVLCGVHPDGTIEIRDPNSPEHSQRSWPLEQIISQARNFWAFRLAA